MFEMQELDMPFLRRNGQNSYKISRHFQGYQAWVDPVLNREACTGASAITCAYANANAGKSDTACAGTYASTSACTTAGTGVALVSK